MTNKKKNYYIIILSLLNVFRSIFLVGQAIYSKIMIDQATNGEDFLLSAIIFVTLIALNIASSLLFFVIRNNFSLLIEVNMKQDIYDKLIVKDINEAKKFHSGEITNIYLSDIQNVKSGLCETIPSFFLYASRFLLSFFALLYFDYRILLVLLGFGIVAIFGARIYSLTIKKYQKRSLESDGRVNAFMQESFENIKIVKAMSAEKLLSSSLNNRLDENKKIKAKRNKISLFGNGGLFVLMEITMTFTMVYGAFGISKGFLSYGSLVGLLQIVSYFESPLSMFSSLMTKLNAYRVSNERINTLFNLKNDQTQEVITDFDQIIFDKVDFSYESKIINNFSLVINKFDTILLKGHSGCGKSTIFNLLLGFIKPESGTIKVKCGTNEYPIENCRNLFSYVAQENILFSGTIEDNARLFIADYNEEKFLEALKIACVYDEIMQKEKKLQTILNERGNGLSLGQIQRILLAISLLKDNPVLLLDEFTSALDKELEKKIVINVASLNKTKIIITHRDIDIPNSKIIYLGEEYE